jgi:DNA-binding NarL/FixJ family response regulator
MLDTTSDARAPIRVLLMYGDPLLRAGLLATIGKESRFEVVQAMQADGCDMVGDGRGSARRAIDEMRTPSIDVVVCDYECAMQWRRECRDGDAGAQPRQPRRDPKLLIVTWRCGEDEIRAALSQGVQGYLQMWCALPELIEAIVAVHQGRRHLGAQVAQRLAEGFMHDALTGRESDVLQLVAQGLSNKSVAQELDIAVATVKAHVKSIFSKLGAGSRTQASALAQQRGLISRDANGASVYRGMASKLHRPEAVRSAG